MLSSPQWEVRGRGSSIVADHTTLELQSSDALTNEPEGAPGLLLQQADHDGADMIHDDRVRKSTYTNHAAFKRFFFCNFVCFRENTFYQQTKTYLTNLSS